MGKSFLHFQFTLPEICNSTCRRPGDNKPFLPSDAPFQFLLPETQQLQQLGHVYDSSNSAMSITPATRRCPRLASCRCCPLTAASITPESGSSLSAVRRRLQKKRQKKNWLSDKQLSLVLISTNRWCSTHSLGGER